MVTEKIGSVELSTFGLRLARLDGNVDLPPFKQVLDEHDYESNLLVLDEQTVQIRLVGFYASKAAMGLAIESFKTQVESELKQTWTFTNHEFAETCVVKDGIKVTPYYTAAEITLTLTIVWDGD